MAMLGRIVRSVCIGGAIGAFPLSTALANNSFKGATNSCTGGSLNICLDLSLLQMGNPGSQHYSLGVILNATNGGSPAGRFTGFDLVSICDFETCFGPNANGCLHRDLRSDGRCDIENGDGNGAVAFSSGGGSGTGSFGGDDDPPSGDVVVGATTSTPEPASLFLVGTGLAGIGGAGAVRRRRRPQ